MDPATALAELRRAEAAYLEVLSGARSCRSHWPADPPGPDYPGTPCQLLTHGPDKRHRHRVAGSQVTVEWD